MSVATRKGLHPEVIGGHSPTFTGASLFFWVKGNFKLLHSMYHGHYNFSFSSFSYCIFPNMNCALWWAGEVCGWISLEDNQAGAGGGMKEQRAIQGEQYWLDVAFRTQHLENITPTFLEEWNKRGVIEPMSYTKSLWHCQNLLPGARPRHLSDRYLERLLPSYLYLCDSQDTLEVALTSLSSWRLRMNSSVDSK